MLGDPGLALDLRHHRLPAADVHLLRQDTGETGADDTLVDEGLPDLQLPPREARGHHGTGSSPARGAVDHPRPGLGVVPLELPIGHNYGVPPVTALYPRGGKYQNVRTRVTVLRMVHGALLPRGHFDHLPHATDLFACARVQVETDGGSIYDCIPHSSKCNVEDHTADLRHFDDGVLLLEPGRGVAQRHRPASPPAALRGDLYQPCWGVESETGLRLPHRHEPRLEQHRRETYRVVPAHRGVDLPLLKDQQAPVCLRGTSGHHEVRVLARVTARLGQEEFPDMIIVFHEVSPLLHHRLPRNVGQPPDDDPRWLPSAVGVHRLKRFRTGPPYRRPGTRRCLHFLAPLQKGKKFTRAATLHSRRSFESIKYRN
eukprot:Hpha_TRINITY_DN33828_c0_g1::TRINITY_DN33828_c0_g1_i1::g.27458::m.27458